MRTKAVAAGLGLALLAVLAVVSCGPGLGFLASLTAAQQCSTGGVATGGDAIPVPSGDPDAKLNIRAASWNVLKSNNVHNVAAGLHELSRTADVIGLQEFRDRFQAAARAALPGWAWSDPDSAVPIAWNAAKFDLVESPRSGHPPRPAKGRVLEYDVTRLSRGPVGSSVGPRSLEWVQLRDRRSHATFVFVNHHLLPHIESRGHPDKRAGKTYLALAQKQIHVELTQVDRFKALGLPVIVTKDGNWDARKSAKTQDAASPYIQAAHHGLYSNWQVLGYPSRGTHQPGERLIDSVSSTTATLIPVQQTILGNSSSRPFHGSDHAPPIVALTNSESSISDSIAKAEATTSTFQKGTVTAVGGVTDAQMSVAQKIYITTLQVGREQGWSAAGTDRAFQIAVSTAQKESSLGADPRSKRPDRNGDGGIFAQRTLPGWYGSINQVNDAGYGTRVFLLGRKLTAADVAAARRAGTRAAGPAGYTIPGLKQVPGWQQLSISDASHQIQRSAFPQMPAQFEKIARALLQAFTAAGLTATTSDLDQILTNDGCDKPSGAAGFDDSAGADIGTGDCPLDAGYAPGHKNPNDCNQALEFLQHQDAINSKQWYRSCLALVANAYGWGYSGVNTAGQHALLLKRAGKLHTSRTNIPRGAVLWWTNSGAGHVDVYAGNGFAYSNDAVTRGEVSRVRWDLPEKQWGQHFEGWSAPYFPHAGGSGA